MKRFVGLLLGLVLVGCGGGGSSGGAGTPAVVPVPANGAQSTAVQRAVVQQALSATNTSSYVQQYGTPSGTVALVRRVMSGARGAVALSACNGGIVTSTSPGPSNNVENISINAYYDAACSQLWYAASGTLTANSSTTGTAALSITYYTLSGAVYEYASPVVLVLGGIGTAAPYFALQASLAASQSSPPYLSLGVGCSVSPSSDGCSEAVAAHLASLGSDTAIAVTASDALSAAPGGGEVISLNGSGSSRSGSLGSTNVVSQGSYAFGIAGGNLIDSVTLTGSLTLTLSGLVVSGGVTVTDAADGLTATVTYNGSTQAFSGSLTQTGSGTTLATYTVNLNGNGSVAYGNGSVATISNWVVLS